MPCSKIIRLLGVEVEKESDICLFSPYICVVSFPFVFSRLVSKIIMDIWRTYLERMNVKFLMHFYNLLIKAIYRPSQENVPICL